MSPEYFEYLPIPRFQDAVRHRIAELYHKDTAPPNYPQTLDNFVAWHQEWNSGLGIWELDRERQLLKRALAAVQEQIIAGRIVRFAQRAPGRLEVEARGANESVRRVRLRNDAAST